MTTGDYSKIRKKRVVDILKSRTFTDDDINFLDNYIKTYFPDPAKALKAILNKDGLKQMYQGILYKELTKGEHLFTKADYLDSYYLIIEGTVNVYPGTEWNPESTATPLKIYSHGTFINPMELTEFCADDKDFIAVCTETSDFLAINKDRYDTIIAENTSAAKEARIKGISKFFLKLRKMDRGSKEEFMQYFKSDKFKAGTVILNSKNKVEELYMIERGKVLLCGANEQNKGYKQNQIIFAVLEPYTLFNESPLLFDKASPYFAICVDEVEVLTLDKANLAMVTDADTLNELRANTQCKSRLQQTLMEKFEKMKPDEIEKNQHKFCAKAGTELKAVNKVFEDFDPKSKSSHQYQKNLEKFLKITEKPMEQTGYATNRIVSRDPNFNRLGATGINALSKLRNEAQTRLGKVDSGKSEDVGDKLQRKSISDKFNINKVASVEEKTGVEGVVSTGVLSKMKMENSQLLARLGVAEKQEGEKKEEEKAEKSEKADKADKVDKPEKTEGSEPQADGAAEKPANNADNKTAEETASPTKNADAKNVDELGLKNTKKNLSNLLGVGLNPIGAKNPSQADIINKKRTNLLRNINLN